MISGRIKRLQKIARILKKSDYLIDVIMTPQKGVSDDRGTNLFIPAWNKKYPNYPVYKKWNPHDFGTYPSVEMEDELFSKALEDGTTFPNGPEQAAIDLAEELGLDF